MAVWLVNSPSLAVSLNKLSVDLWKKKKKWWLIDRNHTVYFSRWNYIIITIIKKITVRIIIPVFRFLRFLLTLLLRLLFGIFVTAIWYNGLALLNQKSILTSHKFQNMKRGVKTPFRNSFILENSKHEVSYKLITYAELLRIIKPFQKSITRNNVQN